MSHFDYITHTIGKIQVTPSSEIIGDGTCEFKIEFNKEEIKSVKEFLDEVLLNKKCFVCGMISIIKGIGYYYSLVEYDRGHIAKQSDDFLQFSDLPIKRVRASGGWGRMDFYIEI